MRSRNQADLKTVSEVVQRWTIIASAIVSVFGFVAWMTATYVELRHARIDTQKQIGELIIEVKELNQNQIDTLALVNRNSTDIAVLKAKTDGK